MGMPHAIVPHEFGRAKPIHQTCRVHETFLRAFCPHCACLARKDAAAIALLAARAFIREHRNQSSVLKHLEHRFC